MRQTALITGASGGIGMELARVHASNGDNLVLVARSKSRLDELKEELESSHEVQVNVIGQDLSKPGAAARIHRETQSRELRIDYLINNAGFGLFGPFAETDLQREEQMIRLNITALTVLTKLYLREMVERGDGKIMNVSSTAAFQPGPKMSVYYATKAYVLHFSEAVANEVKDQGVTVTAFCPGPTRSGFQAEAGTEKVLLFSAWKMPGSRQVAEYGYRAMMRGKPVAIHGVVNRFLSKAVRLLPRRLVVNAVRQLKRRVP